MFIHATSAGKNAVELRSIRKIPDPAPVAQLQVKLCGVALATDRKLGVPPLLSKIVSTCENESLAVFFRPSEAGVRLRLVYGNTLRVTALWSWFSVPAK